MGESSRDQVIEAQQAALDQDMERLIGWVSDHPDISAGLWWDNTPALTGKGHIRMALGVATDPATVAPDIRQLLDHPEYLDIHPHRYTIRDLEALKRTIVAERSNLELTPGTHMSRVAIDPRRNQVTISLNHPDPAAATAILNHYGPDRIHIATQSARFRRSR